MGLLVCSCCMQGDVMHAVMCRMHWAMYNPREGSMREGLPLEIRRTLRKRNFLVEKAKNSNIIGTSC